MSFSTVICFAILVALAIFWVCALSLRVSASYYFLAQLNWRRAIALTLIILLIIVAIWALGLWLGNWLAATIIDPTSITADPWLVELAVRTVLLLVSFLVPWFVIKRWIGGTWAESGQVALLSVIFAALGNTLLLLAVRTVAVDSFQTVAGGMAPTICGPNRLVACANCGCQFRLAHLVRAPLMPDMVAVCPNCGCANPIAQQRRLCQADRFLVSKLDDLHRWDVVVFRVPDESGTHLSRLVGLPGERVELFGGDIFVGGNRLQKPPGRESDLWLPVHDTQWQPRQLGPRSPHWEPAEASSRWRQAGPQWSIAAADDKADILSFSGEIFDELPYNQGEPLPEAGRRIPVADVLLECTLGEFRGEGGLTFTWLFGPRRVEAEISARGKVTLVNLAPPSTPADRSGTSKVERVLHRPPAQGTRVAFAVRDGLACVLEGDRPVVSLNVLPNDLKTARDEGLPKHSCRVSIAAHACQCALARIACFRDVYYRNAEELTPLLSRVERRKPAAAITLGANSYGVLGDNSARSRDSRFVGPIARGDVSGVVRWIYWPPPRWHELR